MAPAPSSTFSKLHATQYPCVNDDGWTKNQFNPCVGSRHAVHKSPVTGFDSFFFFNSFPANIFCSFEIFQFCFFIFDKYFFRNQKAEITFSVIFLFWSHNWRFHIWLLETLFQFRAINNISRTFFFFFTFNANELRRFSAMLLSKILSAANCKSYFRCLTEIMQQHKLHSQQIAKAINRLVADNTAQLKHNPQLLSSFVARLLCNWLQFHRISSGAQERRKKLQTYTAKARK